jgi:hypothetical protein
MLKISKEQLGIFAKARLRDVAQRLADRTIERHPEACAHYGREELASALEPEITFAHHEGFQSLPMLERYVDVCAAVGFGFGAREDWARDILSRQDLSPATKLDQIEETAIFVLLARRG